MKTKVEGISILVAMGTSLLVLSLAFATLNSITRSLDQASNIQRSTQLFFASESGAEAAFFHHNARTAGLNFTGTDASRSINHSAINSNTTWSIQGRTTTSDSGSPTVGNATIVDILKEGQTLKIPLRWDSSANPTEDPPQVDPGQYAAPNNNNDNLSLTFYLDPDDISSSTALDAFNTKYNFEGTAFDTLADGFNFGNATGNDILIDWSFSRKNNNEGIQTFIPTANKDCSGFGTGGYICENDFTGMNSSGLQFDTNDTINGKVLPGSIDLDLDEFWDCSVDNQTAFAGDVCTDFQITVRPLLQLSDTVGLDKVPGLPYELKLTTASGTTPKEFPQSTYTVTSDVLLEDFSQQISIEVPEKTSIGAFDYVIFD